MYVVLVGTISVPSVGAILKTSPLQIVTILFAMTGFGLTVVVTVNVAPLHNPLVGVTVYVAVCGILVGLVSVPLTFDCAVAVAPPVKPPVTTGNVDHA